MLPVRDRRVDAIISHARRLGASARAFAARTRARLARGRPPGGQAVLWAGLAAIAACGAALLVWASAPEPALRPPSRVASAPATVSAPRTTVPAAPPAEVPKPSDSRIAPQSLDLGPYRIRPPFIILDGATFGPEQARPTRLAGLVAPPATAVCFDRLGQLWACGLQARAALSRLITKREVECVPSGDPGRDLVEATCRVDEVDLGRSLLEQGFARAAVPNGPLGALETAARKAEAGLWNGGWRIR